MHVSRGRATLLRGRPPCWILVRCRGPCSGVWSWREADGGQVMKRMWRWVAAAFGGAGLGLAGLAWGTREPVIGPRGAGDTRVPIAVLGDSDSQGYGDHIAFKPGTIWRGGARRASTVQWTEALALLRPEAVDLGAVGEWGCRRRFAQMLYGLGIIRRSPRKWDHRHNFAFSGASSRDLAEGVFAQVRSLMAVMAEDPAAWRRGAVVVRIGIIDLGGPDVLEALANDPPAEAIVRRIDVAAERVVAAARAIRAAHPQTAIVLVGIFDNAEMPEWSGRWRSAAATTNRNRGLDRFDRPLREFANQDGRAAFFDDRKWFSARWGSRGVDGEPAYRTVHVAGIEIAHGCGDEPQWSVLADRHAGLVFNVLWAQSMSATLARLGLDLSPIRDDEVDRFLRDRCSVGR